MNVGSLENVIRGYLRMAEERAETAQQQSEQAVLDIDDLDNFATPESILMSAVCGEDAQDRSDRTILLPWVKFLWESYCQCLELLRVNTHCENLYHDIARMAFQFCLKYNRKMEFRKLCEKLRKHLEDISKSTNQTAGVSITKPETQQLNLDTRLYQLDSAIQMELWQEAYKAIEDIHGLMTLSKKTPVAKTMANYYQKLAMVFWKAGNQLFHAAALMKLFQLTREMKKNITSDELQKMASHVLVATLAIPLPSAHPEFDRFIETDKSPLEKAQRLAVLLGLSQPPTRISLLKDMIRYNVVTLAAPEFQNLYKCLEVEFDPLNLCNQVQTVIDSINNESNLLNQYINVLKDVTLVRLIRQICQVYQSIEFTRLLELAKFADTFYLERVLVDCVRHNDMQIRIDHKKRCIHFGTDLTESQREDHPDGPTLQSMPSEQVRSQLVNMSVVLHRAIAAINPTRKQAERKKLRTQMVQNYHENKAKEHQRILQRQKIIEDRKEQIERLNIEREEEEMRKQEELSRQQKVAEQKRLEQEMEVRERKRRDNEIAIIKEKSLKEKVQQISQTSTGQKVLKKLDETDIKKMGAEEIAAREAEELIKERKDLQAKLKTQEKKVDFYERAKRHEEIPLIQKYLAEKQVQDQLFWQKEEQDRIEAAIAERKNAVAQQERLKRMYGDRDIFLNKLREERKSLFLEKVAKFNEFLEEERKKRLQERKIQRAEERRERFLREKEEEKKRQEEELRKIKQEEERIERERKAKLREAEDEKLRIQAEKQRAKDEEVERKLQEENEKLARSAQPAWRANKERGVGGERDGMRDRQERPQAAAPTAAENWRSKQAPASGDKPAATGIYKPKFMADAESKSNWRPDDDRRDDRGDMRRDDREMRRGFDDRRDRDDMRDRNSDRRDRDRRPGDRDRDTGRRQNYDRDDRRDDNRGDRGGDNRGFRRDHQRDNKDNREMSNWRVRDDRNERTTGDRDRGGDRDNRDKMDRDRRQQNKEGGGGSGYWRSNQEDRPPKERQPPRQQEQRKLISNTK